MNDYTEKIVDVLTGEEVLRPYTSDEIAEVEVIKAEYEAEQAKRVTQEALKHAARQAVLDKLGLTADEVAALLA